MNTDSYYINYIKHSSETTFSNSYVPTDKLAKILQDNITKCKKPLTDYKLFFYTKEAIGNFSYYNLLNHKTHPSDSSSTVERDDADVNLVLEEAGFSKDEQTLLIGLIRTRALNHAEKLELAHTFCACHKAGILYSANSYFYEKITTLGHLRSKLALAIAELSERKILYKESAWCYELLIKNANYCKDVSEFCVALKQMEILSHGHAASAAVFQNPDRAKDLLKAFVFFRKQGLLYQDHPLLWEVILNNNVSGNQLEAFATLYREGMLYQDNAISLSGRAILENPDKAIPLAHAFASLKKAGLLPNDHLELYQAVSERANPRLANALIALTAGGLSYQNHHQLYQAVINKALTHEQVLAIIVFEKAGFAYQNHLRLFDFMLSKGCCNGRAAGAFAMLLKANISFADNADLYKKVAYELYNGNQKPADILLVLAEKGIHFPECYTVRTLIVHAELTMHVLRKFSDAKFSPELHQHVFRKIAAKINLEKVDHLTILHLVDKLCHFAQAQEVKIPAAFDAIIESHTPLHETMSCGPLNKNESTRKIEQLLEELSDKNELEGSKWEYRNECYYVILSNGTSHNLSLLIKSANLSHLTLSDLLIAKLAVKLKKMIAECAWSETSDNPIVKLLPPAQQAAINIYIRDYYKNINLLFRGEKLDSAASVIAHQKCDLIPANFLLGCLLNDAVNKFNHLVDEKKPFTYAQEDWIELYATKLDDDALTPLQRKIVAQDEWLKLYAATLQETSLVKKAVSQQEWVTIYASSLHKGTLARKEALTAEDMTRRQANPWTFPTLTSTSHFEDGTGWISSRKTVFNRIEGRGYSINPSEGEILFSQGTQVVTKEIEANKFVSQIVCSPTLQPSDSYWSDLALEYAWIHHLQHAYKEGNNIYTSGNVTIHRPNHGLAHTYRMKLNIDYVVNYFANHAKENSFREFCQYLDNSQLEWLRIAAAFCVSGRENETSALEDPTRYKRYRQASTDNFKRFVAENKPVDNDKEMIERISDVILYMGHPDYESTINSVTDQTERSLRNFYFRILSMAHKLDLARCYLPTEYKDRMLYFKNHSLESSDQERDLTAIIRYNCALLKAHGNAQTSDITLDGEIVANHQAYRAPFAEVSCSMKRLREITDTVPRPQLMQTNI